MTTERLKTEGGQLTLYPEGPMWDGVTTCTIGQFSCRTREDGARLLKEALQRIREAGRTRVLGPMDGDTWHSYRVVSESDGSPPFLMEPNTPDHVRAAFLDAGFTPVSRYFSARLAMMDWVETPPPETEAFSVTPWDGTDPEGLFREVYAVSSTAFAGNLFYKPIAEEAFLAMYMPVVPMIRPEFILFARKHDGTLAGFLFAIPNYAEGPQTKTLIIKTYASLVRGAGRHLLYACNQAARAHGFDTAIHALIQEANESAQRSAQDGAQIFRRYELLGQRWDG